MALLFSAVVSATPARPEPPRLVNDLAGVMTQAQADSLEQRLVAYSDSTTTQIAVLVVPDLEGQDASSYAIDTFAPFAASAILSASSGFNPCFKK